MSDVREEEREGVSGGEDMGTREGEGAGTGEVREEERKEAGVAAWGAEEDEGPGASTGGREEEGAREGEEPVETEEGDEDEDAPLVMSRPRLKGLLEALIFVADKPIPLNELVKTTGADRRLVRTLLDELSREYEGRGIRLQEVANGFLFRTSAEYAPFLRDKVAKKPVRMTRAQLETLAIIAYRQPLTRPEIDEIRGVDSGAVLKMLLERNLVRILGKKDEPGRPILYGTTNYFLEFFGLKSLRDLPTLRELTELTEESRRILAQKLGEDALPDPTPAGEEGAGGEGAVEVTQQEGPVADEGA